LKPISTVFGTLGTEKNNFTDFDGFLVLKAEKKSAIKTKTKETQSTGRPNIEYCTVEQLIVAISISFIKLFNTEPSKNDLNIESVMGLIAIIFKQGFFSMVSLTGQALSFAKCFPLQFMHWCVSVLQLSFW
jgi:hypothetical protein